MGCSLGIMNLSRLLRRAALGFLLVVALLVVAVVVGMVRSGGDSTGDDGAVTAEEVDRARAALAGDARFRAAIRGADWKVTQATRDSAKGSKAGIGLIVELVTPVDSDGPWKQLRCQGTVSESYTFAYAGVEMVGVVMDRANSKVLGLQPLPSAHLSFRDEDVAKQPTLRPCPRGYEDPEN